MKRKHVSFLYTIIFGIVTFLLSSCSFGNFNHNHVFDQQNTDLNYLAQKATCESPALFYYSCTCGEKGDETFEDGTAMECVYEDGHCIWCGVSSSYQYYIFKLSENGLEYELTDIVIHKNYENFEVPSTYKNLPVTSVDSEFSLPFPYKIENLILPNTIKRIEERAFEDMKEIKNIIFDDNSNLEIIEDFAFYHFKSLISINLPDGLQSIGMKAFEECTSLKEIEIPNTVTTIGSNAFSYCTNLTNVVLPNNETIINENAFYDCINLANVILPNNDITICDYAFLGCDSLTSVIIPEKLTNISSVAFMACQALTVYFEAPERDFSLLGKNNIPLPIVWDYLNNDVATDGYIYVTKSGLRYALKDSTAIIVRQPINIKEVEILETITYKSSVYQVTTISKNAFGKCKNLEIIVIPLTITIIEDYALIVDDSPVSIFCEIDKQPDGWSQYWKDDNFRVYWNGQWQYDYDGTPVPLR